MEIDYIPIGEIDVADELPENAHLLLSDLGSPKLLPISLALGSAIEFLPYQIVALTQGEFDALPSHPDNLIALICETVASVSVSSPPATTSYSTGETLDAEGLVVTALYPSGTTLDVTARCTLSPAAGSTLSTAGTVTVTVSYAEGSIVKTCSFEVTVTAAEPAGE